MQEHVQQWPRGITFQNLDVLLLEQRGCSFLRYMLKIQYIASFAIHFRFVCKINLTFIYIAKEYIEKQKYFLYQSTQSVLWGMEKNVKQ